MKRRKYICPNTVSIVVKVEQLLQRQSTSDQEGKQTTFSGEDESEWVKTWED